MRSRSLPDWHAHYRRAHPLELRSPKRRRSMLDWSALFALVPGMAAVLIAAAIIGRCAVWGL